MPAVCTICKKHMVGRERAMWRAVCVCVCVHEQDVLSVCVVVCLRVSCIL